MAGFGGYGRPGLWLILALALGMRVWTLGEKNLWLDESSSWEIATSSVTQLVTVTAEDPHPPLYFLALKGWIAIFGDSVIALRSLSVASGLLAVYLAFRLAAICLGRGASYAVLLWFAVSPNAIYFSQEARVYALATAAVLGLCLAYRRWVDSDFRSWPALVAYGGCGAAGLYLHYFTALPVVALWLHAIFLATRRPFSWRPWLLVHAGIALLYSPWIGPALAQIERGQPWWRRQVGWEQIPGYAADLLRELTFGIYGVPIVGTVTGAVGVCVLGIGLVGIAAVIVRKLEERDVFVALIALTPVLLGLALLPVTGHMELSRYLS